MDNRAGRSSQPPVKKTREPGGNDQTPGRKTNWRGWSSQPPVKNTREPMADQPRKKKHGTGGHDQTPGKKQIGAGKQPWRKKFYFLDSVAPSLQLKRGAGAGVRGGPDSCRQKEKHYGSLYGQVGYVVGMLTSLASF